MEIGDVPIDKIILEDCPIPNKWFLDSIRREGVKVPVVLESADFGLYKVHDGKRRIFAAKKASLQTVPAIVYQRDELGENEREYLTLIANLHRAPNPIAELKAIKTLMTKGNLTIEEIAANICISMSRLKRVLKFDNLCNEAATALVNGDISERLALQLARLPKDKQQKLILTSEKIEESLVSKAIREHNLSEAQTSLAAVDGLPIRSVLAAKVEEVAAMILASRNVTNEIVKAIEILRQFAAEEANYMTAKTQ